MTDLVRITVTVTIVADHDVDRQEKIEELLELVGGPAWVLAVEHKEATE
jgi:hypothetical protein